MPINTTTANATPVALMDLFSLSEWGLDQYGQFDRKNGASEMMEAAWPLIASIAAGYLTMVFFVKPISHPYWELLRTVRQVWNTGLAAFSLLGSFHVVPPLIYVIATRGVVSTVTQRHAILVDGISGWWLLIFALSKIVELGDTVLLLLSGRKPSFLHWYHHASVLVWCWYEVQRENPMNFVCVATNFSVHTVMYGYFALNDMFDDPAFRRRWGKRITFMQCSQFVIDLIAISVAAFDRIYTGESQISLMSFILPSAVISSYLVLFLQFAEEKYGFYSRFRHALYRSRTNTTDDKDCIMPWHRTDLTLEQRFEEASKMAVMLSYVAEKEDLLAMYGSYKVVKSGPMPALLKQPQGNEKDIAKWDAWNQASRMTKEEAMTNYVKLMDVLSARSEAAQSKSAKAKKMSGRVEAVAQSADPFVLYPVKIAGHGAYHPKRVVLNEEVEALGGFDLSSQETKRTGVTERRWADIDGGENLIQNGAKAVRRACASAGVSLDDLDLIVGGFGGHQFLPDDAALVQGELGLGESGTRAFTVHATCLSFFVALEVAGAFMRDGRYQNVAVFASSIASIGLNPKDPHTAGLFGDGAAAIILKPTDGASAIHRVSMETFGIGSKACRIEGGGTFRPSHHPKFEPLMDRFKMDGEATLSIISKYVRGVLARSIPGLERGLDNLQVCDRVVDIDWVIPHQASAVGLDSMAMFGWQKEKVLRTLHKYGNTISASIPLTLCDHLDNGTIKRGDKILLCGTSAGLSFGAMLLTY